LVYLFVCFSFFLSFFLPFALLCLLASSFIQSMWEGLYIYACFYARYSLFM
jgi:hypothetical protein